MVICPVLRFRLKAKIDLYRTGNGSEGTYRTPATPISIYKKLHRSRRLGGAVELKQDHLHEVVPDIVLVGLVPSANESLAGCRPGTAELRVERFRIHGGIRHLVGVRRREATRNDEEFIEL